VVRACWCFLASKLETRALNSGLARTLGNWPAVSMIERCGSSFCTAYIALSVLFDVYLVRFFLDAVKVALGLPKSAGEKLFSARLYKALQSTKKRSIPLFVRVISSSCDGTIWFFFPLLVGLVANSPFAWPLLLHCFLVPALAELVVKSIFRRPRPSHNTRHVFLAPGERFSFPSGHSTRAAAIACFWTRWLCCALSPRNVCLALCVHFWAISISLSRVTLGRHYPSDVIAGHLVGTLATIISQEVLLLDARLPPPWQLLHSNLLSRRFAN